jgi:hypothetical protein
MFKQPPDDTLAISIETGIQNTGIAIFLLRFSLGQPEADLTTGWLLVYVLEVITYAYTNVDTFSVLIEWPQMQLR